MGSIWKKKAETILSSAGIKINGGEPWDITVKDERFYKRALLGGSLGLGESYMDGWWESEKLDEFFTRVLKVRLDIRSTIKWSKILHSLSGIFLNKQSVKRAFEVGERHYDIGNDLYETMLEERMVYTCGYWSGNPSAANLSEAQEAKLDLVCRKIGLKPGQKILDIGCGWGSFAKFAAEKYGVSVVGITISKEQAELARKLCEGLPVEIKLLDYREIEGEFDHIVSLGMFEHVGYKNYRNYMKTARRCLKDGGLFLLHTIGGNKSAIDTDPWISRYIFPNGMIPSIVQIGKAIDGLFIMEDWHNFGPDYDKTLMAWFKNFDDNWEKLKSKYDERFYRMWKYYLMVCAGSFRCRKNHLWQIVLSKNGVEGGYKAVR